LKKEEKEIRELLRLIESHDRMADSSIPLVASGNTVSPRIMRAMNSDILYRAAEGKVGHRHFSGLKYFDKMEIKGEQIVKKAFGSEFAEVRPISGTQSNMIVYSALLKAGEKIASLPISQGAHVSQAGRILETGLNYKRVRLKGLDDTFGMDMEESAKIVKKEKPKLTTLGGSVIIQWQDPSDIVEAAHKYGGVVVYDASHVAGLIATRTFPNPMKYGVDLMVMTTCKTVPGPSHAWIVGKKEYEGQISKTVFPGFVSGGHLQESIGSIITLLEIRKYGKKFGKTVIGYANALGKELEYRGFETFKTTKGKITETHQVVMLTHPFDGKEIERALEEINILTNSNPMPKPRQTKNAKTGLRLGTQELVRVGCKKKHLPQIAKIIKEYVETRKNRREYLRKVRRLREDFKGVCFT